jgi:hypothetical protein
VVFRVVMLCGLVDGYQRFGGTYRFHLKGEVKMEAIRFSETLDIQLDHTVSHTRRPPLACYN